MRCLFASNWETNGQPLTSKKGEDEYASQISESISVGNTPSQILQALSCYPYEFPYLLSFMLVSPFDVRLRCSEGGRLFRGVIQRLIGAGFRDCKTDKKAFGVVARR